MFSNALLKSSRKLSSGIFTIFWATEGPKYINNDKVSWCSYRSTPYLESVLILLNRIRSTLYCIDRLRPVACKVLRLLYQAYIMPILDYCDIVWSPCSAFYIRRLERVHSRFVSSIPSSTLAVFDLKLSLAERRTYYTAVKVFKILYEIAPPYLHGMFQYASAVSGHVGRNPLRLFVPGIRTNYG